MKNNDLLNLLYVERQRLSEQNNQIGWSIWILVGTVITLSWMLLEHYDTTMQTKANEFCWSQVITLIGDFITIAFAILLLKNYHSNNRINFHSDRFDKSKLPTFIIIDMFIAISLFIYYTFLNSGIIGIVFRYIIPIYLGIKCAELYQVLKYKQQISSLV